MSRFQSPAAESAAFAKMSVAELEAELAEASADLKRSGADPRMMVRFRKVDLALNAAKRRTSQQQQQSTEDTHTQSVKNLHDLLRSAQSEAAGVGAGSSSRLCQILGEARKTARELLPA